MSSHIGSSYEEREKMLPSGYRMGFEIFKERAAKAGVDVTKDAFNGDDFQKAKFPMVVACTGCMMTMNSLGCAVREADETTWCFDCCGGDDD